MKYDIITNLPSGKKVAGIYKIENLINHKVYIGQSLDVYRRFMAHINAKDTTKIHNSLRKYGYKNFSFELIKETYDLNYWEHFLIKLYKSTSEMTFDDCLRDACEFVDYNTIRSLPYQDKNYVPIIIYEIAEYWSDENEKEN